MKVEAADFFPLKSVEEGSRLFLVTHAIVTKSDDEAEVISRLQFFALKPCSQPNAVSGDEVRLYIRQKCLFPKQQRGTNFHQEGNEKRLLREFQRIVESGQYVDSEGNKQPLLGIVRMPLAMFTLRDQIEEEKRRQEVSQ